MNDQSSAPEPPDGASPTGAPSARKVQLSLRTMVLLAVILWLVPFVATLAGTFIDDLIVIYIAALLTCSMHPIVSWLSRRHIPRGVSILAIYLLLAGLLAGAVLLAIPLFVQETGHLISQWPQYQSGIDKLLAPLGVHLSQRTGTAIGTQLSTVLAMLPALLSNVSAIFINVIVIFVLSFFFTADEYFSERLISFVVPPGYRKRTNEIVAAIGNRMGRWVLGQLVIVAYYGVTFSVGLTLLGVPYAVSVGIVTAIVEIIPFVGGFVGLGLGLLVGMSHNVALFIPIVALYLIITNVEGHIIIPNLYGKVIQLHPATIIIALLFGAHAFGIVGALIAMPLAAAVQVVFEELYVHDVIKAAEEAQAARIPVLRMQPPLVLRWPRRRPGQGPTISPKH